MAIDITNLLGCNTCAGAVLPGKMGRCPPVGLPIPKTEVRNGREVLWHSAEEEPDDFGSEHGHFARIRQDNPAEPVIGK